ncbi:MAG: hypothetical protein AB1791_17190, partial [Chloroflexota bacterium]
LVKGDEFQTAESEKGLTIESRGDLKLIVPVGSTLTAASIHGDLSLKGVEGTISLGEVMGDASLSNLGNVEAGMIHGDLAVHNLNGGLSLKEVMGDTAIRNAGPVALGRVHGDLVARYVQGGLSLEENMGEMSLHTISGDVGVTRCHGDASLYNLGGLTIVQQAMGDVQLYGGLAAGKHSLTSAGNIIVRWPADAPLNVIATAPRIVNRLTLDKESHEKDTFMGNLGDGQTTLMLEAKGRVVLKPTEEHNGHGEKHGDHEFIFTAEVEELGRLGEMISARINHHMADLARHLEHKFNPEATREMAERMAKKAEQAAERAMRRAEQAMKQARWATEADWAPQPPPAAKESKVSAEEQLKILTMLQNGTISVEEANTLLQALEK